MPKPPIEFGLEKALGGRRRCPGVVSFFDNGSCATLRIV
jgi:hypothetical protein